LVPALVPALLGAAPELAALLVLALIQGISEFLPISSDGHLVLAQHLMGFAGPHLAVDVALHLGTLGAVLVVFRRDVAELVARLWTGDRRMLGLIALGTLPAAAAGLGFQDDVARLFQSGRAAALGLLVTAGFLWAGERARRAVGTEHARGELGWRDALWIGSAQALALLPGVSRSGSTIATAFLRGVEPDAAARFSFLLSIPAVTGAVVLEVPALVRDGGFGLPLALAVLASFAVGVAALRFLLSFLGRGAFRWCALYCALAGAVALVVV
jgi:undecaprenyl-diphosphatase